MKAGVDKDYAKTVVTGLIVAKVCLGLAAVVALTAVIVIGWTQLPFLVSWLPAILIAVFLAVTMLLLRKDMAVLRRERNTDH